MKTVAIGDLHGHYDQLMELLDNLKKENIDINNDEFVWLGDYVDGGSQTKQVLDFLMTLKDKPNHHLLFGNHESLLLDAFSYKKPIYGDYYLWWNQGGRQTLDSFKTEVSDPYQRAIMQPQELITLPYLNFMRELLPYYETDKYFFVHGGLHPKMSIKDHIDNLGDGSEGTMLYDMIWMRDPFLESRYDWGKKIIFGHTSFKQPLIMDNKIGIDTLPRNTGYLTALILPDEKFVVSSYMFENLE